MKKVFALILAVFMSFALVACGNNEVAEEEVPEETSSLSETLFKDGIFENDDIKVEITKYDVIQPGDNKYTEYNIEEKPVIAFWFSATNKSGETIDPNGAWLAAGFKAIQDNDPNRINELEVSGMPDDSFLETQSETIKEGGTVESCWGYILDDEETPVTLVSEDIVNDTEFGRQDFDVVNIKPISGDTEKSDANKESDNKDESKVSADFKATMDSYEEFFDEYVDFMKKYKEDPTDAEVIAEMGDMMTKEADMLKKMEAMDKDEMTTAEAAYYMEVTGRIYKKLAEVV